MSTSDLCIIEELIQPTEILAGTTSFTLAPLSGQFRVLLGGFLILHFVVDEARAHLTGSRVSHFFLRVIMPEFLRMPCS